MSTNSVGANGMKHGCFQWNLPQISQSDLTWMWNISFHFKKEGLGELCLLNSIWELVSQRNHSLMAEGFPHNLKFWPVFWLTDRYLVHSLLWVPASVLKESVSFSMECISSDLYSRDLSSEDHIYPHYGFVTYNSKILKRCISLGWVKNIILGFAGISQPNMSLKIKRTLSQNDCRFIYNH